MQSFIETPRQDADKLEVAVRLRGYAESYRHYSRRLAARQAERCVQCGDPFCSALGCPLGNMIPQWLEAMAEGELEKAFLLSNETSPFPEILGRVCPHNRLCEGACTLDDGYGAITIGPIEASLNDLAFEAGLTLPFPGVTTSRRVAVVGSGPAGLSCAHFLLRAGIAVDLFERAAHPGGLLTYGIPGFKLDKQLVARRVRLLEEAGLRLRLNCEVGRDLPFAELVAGYDAVFVGTGATRGKRAGLPGEEHPDVHLAMTFLTHVQKRLFGQSTPEFNVLGKRVVVVGGGDTAMDCVRTALREGAESVTCLYRRDEANMPGSAKEYRNALEEGVVFCFNESPREILMTAQGALAGIDMVSTRLTERGPDGRRRVEEIPGTEHCVPADIIILALGFDVAPQPWLGEAGVETGRWQELLVDPASGRTSHPKVYAGGDCQRGADLVVTAAADGRRAALAMLAQLLEG